MQVVQRGEHFMNQRKNTGIKLNQEIRGSGTITF